MTEEAMKLDATKLGMIWTTYHHERDITSAVAKEEVYSKLQKRMAECPMVSEDNADDMLMYRKILVS